MEGAVPPESFQSIALHSYLDAHASDENFLYTVIDGCVRDIFLRLPEDRLSRRDVVEGSLQVFSRTIAHLAPSKLP